MTKRNNIKHMGDAELTKMVEDARKELFTTRVAAAGSRPKDTSAAREARKKVARALTEIRARSTDSRQAATK